MAKIDPTESERAALAHAITRANGLESEAESGKAPIVAAILIDDEVIAWGDNQVHLENDPSRHAEIVAIANACKARGEPSLEGATLISTLQPCEMCLAAMRFADIDRLVYAAGRPDVAQKYFMFHGLDLDDFHDASDRDFDWAGDIMAEDVMGLYATGKA